MSKEALSKFVTDVNRFSGVLLWARLLSFGEPLVNTVSATPRTDAHRQFANQLIVEGFAIEEQLAAAGGPAFFAIFIQELGFERLPERTEEHPTGWRLP